MPDMNPNLMRILNGMSRTKAVQILENHGYGVYESEKLEDLLETIRIDVEAGEITYAELED